MSPYPVAAGNITLSGLGFRGHTVDITISTDSFEVVVDGVRVSAEPDGTVVAVRPAASSCGSPNTAG